MCHEQWALTAIKLLRFFCINIDTGKYLRACQHFYARKPPGSAGPPNVNMGPPNIPKSTRARMLKLKTQLDIVKYSLWVKKDFAARGRPWGVGPSSVNLGPPNISESQRARKLKLKTPLDIVTYSPRIQKNSARGRRGGHRAP